MELSLSGKTALLCGASAGIGLASAIELSLLGARCILLARNEKKLAEAVGRLQGKGHEFRVADFDDPDQVQAAADSVLRQGVVDVLVNNSGGPPGGPVLQASPADFTHALQRHLICNQLL